MIQIQQRRIRRIPIRVRIRGRRRRIISRIIRRKLILYRIEVVGKIEERFGKNCCSKLSNGLHHRVMNVGYLQFFWFFLVIECELVGDLGLF